MGEYMTHAFNCCNKPEAFYFKSANNHEKQFLVLISEKGPIFPLRLGMVVSDEWTDCLTGILLICKYLLT